MRGETFNFALWPKADPDVRHFRMGSACVSLPCPMLVPKVCIPDQFQEDRRGIDAMGDTKEVPHYTRLCATAPTVVFQ